MGLQVQVALHQVNRVIITAIQYRKNLTSTILLRLLLNEGFSPKTRDVPIRYSDRISHRYWQKKDIGIRSTCVEKCWSRFPIKFFFNLCFQHTPISGDLTTEDPFFCSPFISMGSQCAPHVGTQKEQPYVAYIPFVACVPYVGALKGPNACLDGLTSANTQSGNIGIRSEVQ